MLINTTKLGGRLVFPQTAVLVALLGLAGQAQAQNTDNPLTWHGLTLYGKVDVGESYQSHGQPQNDYFGPGGYTFPNKNSTDSQTQLSHNGSTLSVLGLLGEHAFSDEWSGLFKMESVINPVTFKFTDNQKSLTQNNGKPITDQTTATDSSLTGPFSSALYLGVKSKTYGQLTYGRQNTPLKDNFYKYDPMSNSGAFSALGAYGVPAGGGSTENARLNNSLRYQVIFDKFRLDALYAGKTRSQGGEAWQLGLGGKSGGFSVDGAYALKKQAITALSLGVASPTSAISVTQLTTVPIKAGYNYAPAGSVSVNDALVGIASDNRAWGLFAKYDFGAPVVFAGYENITYSNPSSRFLAGGDSIGGYTFAIVNNGAYRTNKVFQVKWLGVKYSVTPKLDLIAAAYRLEQNDYSGNSCAIPAATSPGTTIPVNRNNPCSAGYQNSYSLAGKYNINSYLNAYVGIMASDVSGGMASGWVHTSAYNVMAGVVAQY